MIAKQLAPPKNAIDSKTGLFHQVDESKTNALGKQ
jgi:hypothetical protein